MRSITRRAFLATQAAAVSAAAPQKTPNLVFLLSDQQAYDMLGCYGNRQIITPNIDLLATQGTRFKYCISNSPVCTPYRGIFFSGQHPLHTGALGNDLQMVPGGGRYLG